MRLIHLVFAVFLAGLIMAIARDEVGRVALAVFVTGVVEIVLGTAALMSLFQSIGAIAEADRPLAFAQAFAATGLVLLVATLAMNAVLWAGVWLVQVVVGPI